MGRPPAARLLLARCGGFRTDAIVRLYGWATLQHTLQMQNVGFAEYLRSVPIEYHLFAVCGALCLVLGARPLLLAATTGCFAWFLATVIGGAEVHRPVSGYFLGFIADEFLVYLTIPGLALACFALGAWRGRNAEPAAPSRAEAVDENLSACCRILVVTALGFAALHKVNADFFDPEVSCMSLHRDLARWWDLPLVGMIEQVGPLHVVVGEALVPVLLLAAPALGMPYTLGLLQAFAHIGPTAFVAMLFAAGAGFLEPGDDRVLRPFLRRAWPALLLLAALALPLSRGAYGGEKPWLPFYTFQGVSLALAACCAALIAARLRGEGRLAGSPGPALLGHPKRGAMRPFLVLVLAASLLNGMTPYLGAKYRFGYAMLSNLRTDAVRWNHLFLPRWLHLPEHDPFVRVTRVVATGPDGRPRPPPRGPFRDGGRLTEALFAPYSFARRARGHRRAGDDLDVTLVYRDRERHFPGAVADPGFWRFVEALPAGRLFQAKLTLRGPQVCMH